MDIKENIEKQIRDGFQNAYKERMLTMKNFYEMRYQTLQQTISNSYKKVLQDEILTTMIRDTTTVNYLQQRVKQLFKQIVQNEREVLIQKLGLQYSQLKFHYQQMQKKYVNLKKQSENNQQRSFKDRISSQTEKSEITQAFRKKDQQIFELKLDAKQKLSTIKQKQRIIEDYQNKINQFKQQNNFLKVKLQKFEQQVSEVIGVQKTKFQLKDVDLQESQKKLTLLQNTIKQIQKANQEKIQLVEKKYRKKIGQYKQKIEEYKAKILQLINQKPSSEVNQNYEHRIQQLQRKIVIINRQAQKKINQLKSQKQKDKILMQRKYQTKYKQLQTYFEKLVQQKVQQSEKVACQAVQKIKSEQQQIKNYIQYLEENSSPIQEYKKLEMFCQNLKQHLENKILQNQKITNYFGTENKQLQIQYQQYRKNWEEGKIKYEQLQNHHRQALDKIRQYQQQLTELKNGEKKLKALFNNSEANMRIKQQQNIDLRNQISKIRSENTQYIGTIGQRQNLFLQKMQQVQQMQKRMNKLTKQLQIMQQQRQKNENTLSNFKRNMNQKQNEISILTQQNQFKIDTLNSQLHKNNLTIDSNNQRIKQLLQRCSKMESMLVQNSKQKTELQTGHRRLQLQNRFVKQSEQAFRKQHEAYIADYKKKIQQKGKIIQSSQNQLILLKKVHSEQNQVRQNKIRKLGLITKKIHRIYSNEMDNLKINLKDIKIYAESVDKLLKSEVKLMQSNATLKLKEQMLTILSNKNQEIRKIKQNLDYQKNQQINSTKQKSQQTQTNYKQKFETQTRNFNHIISAKQKQIERMQKQMKKYIIQKDEWQQINRNLQKKIKEIELAYQNQKIQSKSKINQIIRSFDSQKMKIMQQFQFKREKQQNQLQQLTKIFKNLKKQLENSKLQIEKQRNQFLTQSNIFNRKEKQLQKQLQKKKIQIDNLNEQIKLSKQSFHKIDNELNLVIQRNKSMSQSLAESQLKNHQLTGQYAITKAKADRLLQQNQQMKRQLRQKQNQSSALQNSKRKIESQLKQIKSTINKSNKSHQLRALQQLGMQAKQLTNKVSQIRKIDLLLSQDRTPLRS